MHMKFFERKSCQIIQKCRIESTTKEKKCELARDAVRKGPFPYKFSTFAKLKKSPS